MKTLSIRNVLAVVIVGVIIGTAYITNPTLFTAPKAEAAGQNVSGYAWSDMVGWISFSGVGYSVTLDPATGAFSGYAWSGGTDTGPGVGWISFTPSDLGGCPSAPCSAQTDASGNVTGWARALANGGGWDGWIKLNGVTVAPATGVFSGYAFGGAQDTTAGPNAVGVIGWIDFGASPVQGPILSTFSCTGLPANATPYPAPDNTGLIANTAYTYSTTDTGTKCQFNGCTVGYSWNGTSCVLTSMSGTLSSAAPSCIIAFSSNTCTINPTLSWGITNPANTPTAITAAATTNPVTAAVNTSVTNTLTTPQSGTSNTSVVPWGGRTFYLYNNAVQLAQTTVTASCTPGTSWNGTSCVATGGFVCTGALPANATPYPAPDNTGLTADTPYTYSSTGTSAKCEYYGPCTQSNPTFFWGSCTASGPQCVGTPSPRNVPAIALGACSDGSMPASPITDPTCTTVSQVCTPASTGGIKTKYQRF